MSPEDTTHCLLHPQDYRSALMRMNWAEDFGVNERRENADASGSEDDIESAAADQYDIDAICTALNVYYLENSRTAKAPEQRKQAAKLLRETAATLDKLLSLLNLNERNAYLSSAIFATLDQNNLDNKIFEFGQKTKELSKFLEYFSIVYNKASDAKEYSDALPKAERGRPGDVHFDTLIAKLNRHVSRIKLRAEGDRPVAADIAGAIGEILHKTQFGTLEQKTLENRLSSQGDYQEWLANRSMT